MNLKRMFLLCFLPVQIRKKSSKCKIKENSSNDSNKSSSFSIDLTTEEPNEDGNATCDDIFNEVELPTMDKVFCFQSKEMCSSDTRPDIETIADIVIYLGGSIDGSCTFDMVIRQSHVLSDALCRMDKAAFDPRKQLNVVFVGEGADSGGLIREFFKLLKPDMNKYLEETGCFKHNSVAYQVISK